MLSTNNYDDASDGIDVTKVGNDGERSSGKRKRSVVSSSSPSKSASPQKICPKKRKLSNVIDRLRAATDTPPVVKRRASAPRKRKLSDSFDADLQQSMLGDRGFSTEADSTKPPTYFDKLPQRQPFDDINTSRMDNVFRASCFKNAVCTITTNLKININHFTNLIGGQLTSTLPGNRLVLVINGQRYSVICYNTGRFVLTNLFFFNRLKDIYDFFINFCLLLLKRGIATLTAVDGTREGPERRFRILFLVENCQFSFRFKDEVLLNKISFTKSKKSKSRNEYRFFKNGTIRPRIRRDTRSIITRSCTIFRRRTFSYTCWGFCVKSWDSETTIFWRARAKSLARRTNLRRSPPT